MNLPMIQIEDMDIKLKLDDLILNVLYVKSGYFYRPMPKHSHSQGSYELHYIPRGKGHLIANGRRYALTPGTLFMTGPEIEHEQIPDMSDPMLEYCIFFEIISGQPLSVWNGTDTSRTEQLSQWLLDTPFWIGSDQENLMLLFEMLAREITLQHIGFHAMTVNILELIVSRMIRQYYEDRKTLRDAPVKTLNDRRLVMIESSFLYEYHSITLHQLAQRIGLSTRQTERTIHKQYGMSFQHKKLQLRMEAAEELLITTNQTIRDIAITMGFTTPERFSHSFKDYFQMSPSEYRRTHA